MADAALLEKKKNVRRGHKGSATKLIGRINTALAASPADEDKLRQLKLSLTDKLQVLKILDDDIVEATPEDELAREIEQADEAREEIHLALTKLERALRPFAPAPPTVVPRTVADPVAAIAPTPAPTSLAVKLPKLTLQPFNGEITHWTSFWDSFKASVHDNTTLSPVDKFNYLRGLLQRSALEAISGLALTDANYPEAVSILERRFGNKQQIISKHMDTLIHVEAVTSPHNVKGLRRLYDLIESNVRSLKSLGVDSASYGTLLASVLITKIPPELQLILSRESGGDEWKLDSLLTNLEKELQVRERMTAVQRPDMRMVKPHKEPPSAHNLLAGNSSKFTCSYCQRDHPSNTCGEITNPHVRKQHLQKTGRCFVCLRRGHVSRECTSTRKCGKCNGRHHISICSKGQDSQPPGGQTNHPLEPGSSTDGNNQPSLSDPQAGLNVKAPPFRARKPQNTSLWVNSSTTTLLQTAQTRAFNLNTQHPSIPVRIVFDNGSQQSYITESIAQELSLPTLGRQSLTVMTFGATDSRSQLCERVKLGLELKDGQTTQISLYTTPLICQPLTYQPISLCQDKFEHIMDLELADTSETNSHYLDVDILIGSDQYWNFITGEVRRGSFGPVAVNTKFGWVLSGPTTTDDNCQISASLLTRSLITNNPSDLQYLDDNLQRFWDLESLGILPRSITHPSVQEQFDDTICFVNGRYQVRLPWKESHPPLNDHHSLCLSRLEKLMKRLYQEPIILHEYDAVIKEQIRQGIVEAVGNSPEEHCNGVHFLPHHAIVRQDKDTTKIRIVYDASARSGGPSLNDCLNSGPKYDQKILDLLLRFRIHKVAVTADIEKAFLMVAVAEEDRDVLRFLWYDDVFSEQPEIIQLRFARVVFGVTSSPFLLNATVRHHLEQYKDTYPELVEKLIKATYVDDIVTGANSEEAAYQLFNQAKEILREGGFNLRKFNSNSTLLQTIIGVPTPASNSLEEESYSHTVCNSREHLGEKKILGVRWDLSTDNFIVSLEEVLHSVSQLRPTKRRIVSLVGKIYDPLGILSPLVILFKIFLQQLCAAKLDWDEELAGQTLEKWTHLCTLLRESKPLSIPRCYFYDVDMQAVEHHLCGFCDASFKAYAAVVYLLIETPSQRYVRILASKTRVTPLKSQTIPRLELLSALLLARLISTITTALESELCLSDSFCFSDSMVAVYWIKGTEKVWKPFVQNRVSEIRSLLPPSQWSHCSGHDNPADLPSRGQTSERLLNSRLWMNGPEWLQTATLASHVETQMPEECRPELRMNQSLTTHGMLSTTMTGGIGALMEIKNFSSFDRLISVTTRVLAVCRLFRSTIQSKVTTDDQDDRTKAESLWIIDSQLVLVKEKAFSIWKGQFNLFQDEKRIWRCGGRIQNADLTYSTKHPILIARSHYLATLLVWRAHERVFHGGVKSTLTELRSQFWIICGRSLVKQLIGKCVICRRFEGKPYNAPIPPPLPPFRVQEAPPFSSSGVDFAGPLYIKHENELSTDSTTSKVWIALFTCCITRAVHLELVHDQSVPSFIRCLKRFCARRGTPSRIVSDNAKTFKATSKALYSLTKHDEVQQFSTTVGIKWIFNLPKAPWWGGMFERLVKSTKRCLRKILGQSKLTYEELATVLAEVEGVLNSRPLTYVSSDDIEEPLTPSHLLTGRRITSLPDHLSHAEEEESESNSDVLTRRMKHLNRLLEHFW